RTLCPAPVRLTDTPADATTASRPINASRADHLDHIPLRTPLRNVAPVQSPCDHAERIEPVLVGGGALQPDGPADGLPALAEDPHPDDLAVDAVEAGSPSQSLLHAADRCGRRQRTHRPGLLAHQITELVDDPRPEIAVALHLGLGQLL